MLNIPINISSEVNGVKKCLLRRLAQGGTNETEECIKGCEKSICQEKVQGHPVPVRVPRA